MAERYDVEAARAAGLSDGEIAQALASRLNYDLEGARSAGVPDAEIATTLTTRFNQSSPQGAGTQPPGLRPGKAMLERAGGIREDIRNSVMLRDPGVDYETGVKDFSLRAGFSRMSNDAERANYLDQAVGKGNYGRDRYGRYYIMPEGLAKRGLTATKPMALEEPGSTRYDVADILGDAPAMLGATGGALMASGAGFLPGVGASALGGMAGKAADEIIKRAQGLNLSSPMEQAGRLVQEGASAAAGEGVGRGLIGAGRFAMNPYGRFADPERQALTREALNAGLTPRVFQFQPGGGLLSRFQGLGEQVLSPTGTSKIDIQNRASLTGGMDRLQGQAGTPQTNAGEALISGVRGQIAGLEQTAALARTQAEKGLNESLANISKTLGTPDPNVGAVVQEQIRTARTKFGEDASKLYTEVDALVGGKPIVPTAAVKDQLLDLMKNLPTDQAGNKIFPTPELAAFFKKYGDLAEFQTTAQMQQLRTDFRNAAESMNLVPGVDKRRAALLKKSVDQAFEDTKSSYFATPAEVKAIEKLKEADEFYRKGIQRFDAPSIAALTRDASQTGNVAPERVVDTIIRPGHTAAALRVKGLVPEATWKKVQDAHFSDLIADSTRLVDGVEQVSGSTLWNKINKMGRTLDVVYGAEAAKIRKYAAELAARDGKLDPSLLKGNIADNLRAAAEAQVKLDKFLSENYLSQLAKTGQEATQAADFIFKPNSPQRIATAKQFYGETSKEFQGLQNEAMKKILADFVQPGQDPLIKIFDGKALLDTLNKYGRSTLEETFGAQTTNDLYQFARTAQFVTQTNPNKGSIAAAMLALNPLRHAWKLVDIAGSSYLLRQPGAIRWLSEGINTGNAGAAAGAITRLGALATSIVRDKTSAGAIDLNAPLVNQGQQP